MSDLKIAASLHLRIATTRYLRHYEAFLLSKLKIVRHGLKESANELSPIESGSYIAASMVIARGDPIFTRFFSDTPLAVEVPSVEFSKVAKVRGDAIVSSVSE